MRFEKRDVPVQILEHVSRSTREITADMWFSPGVLAPVTPLINMRYSGDRSTRFLVALSLALMKPWQSTQETDASRSLNKHIDHKHTILWMHIGLSEPPPHSPRQIASLPTPWPLLLSQASHLVCFYIGHLSLTRFWCLFDSRKTSDNVWFRNNQLSSSFKSTTRLMSTMDFPKSQSFFLDKTLKSHETFRHPIAICLPHCRHSNIRPKWNPVRHIML